MTCSFTVYGEGQKAFWDKARKIASSFFGHERFRIQVGRAVPKEYLLDGTVALWEAEVIVYEEG